MSLGHQNEARSTNYLFTIGFNRELTFSAQSSNINELTMGQTPFMSGAKDLKLPSNKVDNGPLTVGIVLSEDYNEWVEIFKWMMLCKNTNGAHLSQTKPCELVTLDAQSQPGTRFVYGDCFPIELGGAQLAVNDDGSNVLVTDVTFAFNKFHIQLPDGTIIDEQYTG